MAEKRLARRTEYARILAAASCAIFTVTCARKAQWSSVSEYEIVATIFLLLGALNVVLVLRSRARRRTA